MHFFPADFDPLRAALAGALASLAYAAEMYLDMWLTGSRFDDIQLVEGLVRGRRARIPVAGFTLHLVNGAALGVVYALAEPFLPGPSWARGLLFGVAFLLAVWPSVPLVDRFHPLIRKGELPTLSRPVAFVQNVARHLVFGLALGVLYGLH